MINAPDPLGACWWKYDESTCSWDTKCDNKYQFMNDGPRENDYRFCPGCGSKIVLAGERDATASALTAQREEAVSERRLAVTQELAVNEK